MGSFTNVSMVALLNDRLHCPLPKSDLIPVLDKRHPLRTWKTLVSFQFINSINFSINDAANC